MKTLAAPALVASSAAALVPVPARAEDPRLDSISLLELRRHVLDLRRHLHSFRVTALEGRLPKSVAELRLLIEDVEVTLSALSGLQLAAIDAFDRVLRQDNAAKGLPAREQGRGVARGVQMATHTTPARASRMVATAKAMSTELHHTFDGLCSGRLSAYRAQIIADEAAKLPTGPRREWFDKRLAGDIGQIETLGPKSLRRRAQALVDELHPNSAEERFAEQARTSCHVQVEELGHGMSRLSVTMPTPHAAYIYTVLDAAASGLANISHDPKTGQTLLPRGQVMAQALYQHFTPDGTNCSHVNDSDRDSSAGISLVPVTIDLVISDQGLLGFGNEPATVLTGGGRKNLGTIPAAIARALVANGITASNTGKNHFGDNFVWLRKLYVNDHGVLTATSSRQRFHPESLATMLRLRDLGVCRTPWCDAPIRHSDHVIPWRNGGATSLNNSAGQCVRCNQSKESPGHTAKVTIDPTTRRQEITYTEPTGQHVKSIPPKLPKPAAITNGKSVEKRDSLINTTSRDWIYNAEVSAGLNETVSDVLNETNSEFDEPPPF